MLEKEELDVVGVCLPYYRNAEASLAAARKGIHIVSEKPVATTLVDLDALKTAVGESKVRLTSMMNMRCFPPYRAARKAVQEGLIGEPILLTSQKSYRFGGGRTWFYKDFEDVRRNHPVGRDSLHRLHEMDVRPGIPPGFGLARQQESSRLPGLSGPRRRSFQTQQRWDGHDQP
ncbi:MAG: Gfo/Idh/MocA family oxidoreductase [Rhodopirellula sp.]|nr:Gfo/Idh/MocA family oxidoreductase [Rhodopirellula sp.]